MSKTRKRLKPTKHNLTVEQLEACVVKLYLQTKMQQASRDEVGAITKDLNRAEARIAELEGIVATMLELLPADVEQDRPEKMTVIKINPDTVLSLKSQWSGYCFNHR